MATMRSAMTRCSRSTIRPSTVMTPLRAFSGWRKGRDDLARPGDFLLRGREHLVTGLDLRGMDQRLAVHAEGAALLAFGAETLLIPEIIIHAVDHIEAKGARRQHLHGQPWHDGEPVAERAGPQFLEEVIGPEHQARKTLARVPATAAMSRALRIEAGVSIIAHSRVVRRGMEGPGSSPPTHVAGPSTPWAPGWRRVRPRPPRWRSSMPQGVSSAFTRMMIRARHRRFAWTIAFTLFRAADFSSGATESSRSRISASAGRPWPFQGALIRPRHIEDAAAWPDHFLDPLRYQWRKCRKPVNTMLMPAWSAAAMTSPSRTDPPGWMAARRRPPPPPSGRRQMEKMHPMPPPNPRSATVRGRRHGPPPQPCRSPPGRNSTRDICPAPIPTVAPSLASTIAFDLTCLATFMANSTSYALGRAGLASGHDLELRRRGRGIVARLQQEATGHRAEARSGGLDGSGMPSVSRRCRFLVFGEDRGAAAPRPPPAP